MYIHIAFSIELRLRVSRSLHSLANNAHSHNTEYHMLKEILELFRVVLLDSLMAELVRNAGGMKSIWIILVLRKEVTVQYLTGTAACRSCQKNVAAKYEFVGSPEDSSQRATQQSHHFNEKQQVRQGNKKVPMSNQYFKQSLRATNTSSSH